MATPVGSAGVATDSGPSAWRSISDPTINPNAFSFQPQPQNTFGSSINIDDGKSSLDFFKKLNEINNFDYQMKGNKYPPQPTEYSSFYLEPSRRRSTSSLTNTPTPSPTADTPQNSSSASVSPITATTRFTPPFSAARAATSRVTHTSSTNPAR